jgi:hypothetical protein
MDPSLRPTILGDETTHNFWWKQIQLMNLGRPAHPAPAYQATTKAPASSSWSTLEDLIRANC